MNETTTTQDTTTVKTAHEIKVGMLPHIRTAFLKALAEQGIALKDFTDPTTRHAMQAVLRCGAEILADSGWGYRHAAGQAGQAVSNVFGYRLKLAAEAAAAAGKPTIGTLSPDEEANALEAANAEDGEEEEDEGSEDEDEDEDEAGDE